MKDFLQINSMFVAPFRGAWIEIKTSTVKVSELGSLPLGERGLKSVKQPIVNRRFKSLPLGERGLKLKVYLIYRCNWKSLPLGERGLKLSCLVVIVYAKSSLPLGERGLKSCTDCCRRAP